MRPCRTSATLPGCGDDPSPLGHETVDGIVRKLMEIDTKLQILLEYHGLEDDEEEENDA